MEEYLHTKKLKERLPFTIVRFSYYFNNMATLLKPRKTDENTYVFDIPMEGVAMDAIDVTQGGECVYGKLNAFSLQYVCTQFDFDFIFSIAILENPDAYRYKTIGLSGDKMTIQKYCDVLSKHLSPKKFVVS